jgi:putative ABC transport system permease protein
VIVVPSLRRLGRRIAYWIRFHARQAELREELAFHHEQLIDDLQGQGLSVDEARAATRRMMGNETYMREEARAVWWSSALDGVAQDSSYAWRGLRRSPVFTAIVVVTLAIGIGANTALFSIVRTVLLDPLPYPSADRLVVVSGSPWNRAEIAMAFRDMPDVFQDVAAYSPEPIALTGVDQPFQLQGSRITPNFFRLFGAGVAHGRDFTKSDAQSGAPPTAIISYDLWTTHFGGRADVIGRLIDVDDRPYQIIGVTSKEFHLYGPRADDPQVWLPFELGPRDEDGRPLWVIPVARMKGGVTMVRVQSAVDRAISVLFSAHPELGRANGPGVRLATIHAEIARDARAPLVILQLTAATLLLIACVNVANLLLARASSRRHEVTIRSVLGASRGRLIRQVLTESVMLSLLGGIAGTLLLGVMLGWMLKLAPSDLPRLGDVHVDMSLLLTAITVSAGTGVACGLVSATGGLNATLHDRLKEAGRGHSRSSRQKGVSQTLIVTEVALALVLLVGATLMVKTFLRLSNQPLGFRTRDVATMSIQIPPTRYDSVRQLDAFYTAMLDRIDEVTGVQAVALSNNLPISRGNARRAYVIEGDSKNPLSERTAQYAVVSPDYFRVLDVPVIEGRVFTAGDSRDAKKVAIIDREMAREAFSGQNPIGRRFRFEDGDDAWLTVVGVVANIRGGGLGRGAESGFYIPYTQRPATRSEIAVGHIATVLVRSSASPALLTTPMRAAVWRVNPRQPIMPLAPLADAVARGAAPQRFRAELLGGFAAIALALVLVGIYGVIEYAVAERTHEFGVRMALGATSSVVLKEVLLWGLRLAAIGAVLGVAAVVALERYVASMLFDVTATDPVTLVMALAVIGAVAIVACLIPAQRAMSVDPSAALRSELLPH